MLAKRRWLTDRAAVVLNADRLPTGLTRYHRHARRTGCSPRSRAERDRPGQPRRVALSVESPLRHIVEATGSTPSRTSFGSGS